MPHTHKSNAPKPYTYKCINDYIYANNAKSINNLISDKNNTYIYSSKFSQNPKK